MSSPPPKSLVPAQTVWPPSNPSGTVIPFPLPWGQTGCCPPGGLDALMKCYCDLQQASAFIGQVMLDQINNNPAITEAIIAAIEKSGSNLPLLGVTNGSDAQPGQVGEYISFSQQVPVGTTETTVSATMGVLQPGDWDYWFHVIFSGPINIGGFQLVPLPVGFTDPLYTVFVGLQGADGVTLASSTARALISTPSLVVIQATTLAPSAVGPCIVDFNARRMR